MAEHWQTTLNKALTTDAGGNAALKIKATAGDTPVNRNINTKLEQALDESDNTLRVVTGG